MKNVFFALAFMLVGTFAFANTEVTPDVNADKIESLLNVDNVELSAMDAEFSSCGFPVFFDDGGTGDWGGSGSFDYGFDCNTNSFWDDFFFMLDNVLPGWDSICVNC